MFILFHILGAILVISSIVFVVVKYRQRSSVYEVGFTKAITYVSGTFAIASVGVAFGLSLLIFGDKWPSVVTFGGVLLGLFLFVVALHAVSNLITFKVL